MKILVTGGCGFIGSNFVRYEVLKKNHTVLNFDSLTYSGNKENLSDLSTNSKYRLIEGDICNQSLLKDVIFDFTPTILFTWLLSLMLIDQLMTP